MASSMRCDGVARLDEAEPRPGARGFHSVSRLRAYALSAELNTIASARTLADRIACTSCSVRVAWHPSQHAATAEQVRRPSVVDV